MNLKRVSCYFTLAMTGLAALLTLVSAPSHAQQVAIDKDDIGGVVRGPAGPEAGVWVIAETTELPTKFAKIVVTNDQTALRSAASAARSPVDFEILPRLFWRAVRYPQFILCNVDHKLEEVLSVDRFGSCPH